MAAPLLVEHARDAEVEDLEHAVLREEQVRRLDVAMDDVLLVRELEDLEETVHVAEHLVDDETTAEAHAPLFEGLAFEQLEDEERDAVLIDVVVEHAHRAGVLEEVREIGLAHEATRDVARLAEVIVEELDGDAVAVAMRRSEHHRRPAYAQHLFDEVLAA